LKSVVSSGEQDLLEAIDDSVVSCEGLAHIIDNIDLVGRNFRNQAHLGPGGAEIRPLIEEVVAASAHMAQSHGVRVELEQLPDGVMVAKGGRDVLERAVTNLLRNSVQHSPSNGTVRVSGRVDVNRFVVRFSDSGTRLPASDDTAFTAAGQVQAKSVPKGRYSRGLGLYCAGLAAAAGHATVRTIEPPPGATNAFELVIETR
jgi:signal transduction histidine kinase